MSAHLGDRAPVRRAGPVGLVAVMALSTALAGCTATGQPPAEAGDRARGEGSATPTSEAAEPTPTASVASVSSSLDGVRGRVPVDDRLELTAEQGTFEQVRVTFGPQRRDLPGRLGAGDRTWSSPQRLEPGRRYLVRSVVVDAAGREKRVRSSFSTDDLTLDEQTYPSIAPLDGETVGVGMPVIVSFDVPVTDRASIERHLEVSSSSEQAGSWHWISDTEVHWRPRSYWEPGTDVTVRADVNSIPAGEGIYGQLSRTTRFTVGEAMISRIDVARHRMRVVRDGRVLRTIAISAGKPGFETRSGTKVIIEKFRSKRMDAATTGISRDDPEYYNLANVEYAMRVTYSGEFLHAAPWSVGSQGSANVSHGCVGMSTADAAWLYDQTKRGDVVEVTGTDRQMTATNGFGDWNVPFADYRRGSALG